MPTEQSGPSSVKAALAIGLPLSFASGLAVAGLLLLAALEFSVGDKLLALEARYHGLLAPTADAGGDATEPVAARAQNAAEADGGVPLSLQNDVDFLRAELDDAGDERTRLLEQVETLTRQLAGLTETADAGAETPATVAEGNLPAGASADVLAGTEDGPGAEPLSEFESLVAAGVDAVTADNLQQRTDEFALRRLELFDQASREGWLGSDEFAEQLEALDTDRVDHRTELGDANFDRYLFESGRDNRINVASVIGGSAADLSGIQSGDVIDTYAGVRVFTLPELQNATREGVRGEAVQVTVQRNGEPMVVDVPRGPLGVTLNGTRVAPSGT